MRHKYATTGIVLARASLGEASVLVTLLTPDLGLIRARAQSIRAPGAKLASALQTLAESDIIVVRGKEGWRLSGAVLGKNWFEVIQNTQARLRIGRTIGLLLRMIHGESVDALIYALVAAFLDQLETNAEDSLQDAAECLIVLRFLHLFGFDAGDVPGGLTTDFSQETLEGVLKNRADIILRINRGISASGL